MSGWFPRQGIEAVLVGAGLMAFGYLLASAVLGTRIPDRSTRWALALPAVVVYALILMIAHMAAAGFVFSHPWLVRSVTGAVALALAGRWLPSLRPKMGERPRPKASARASLWPVALMLGVVALGVALWGTPVARVVPLGPAGADNGWHMGWAAQLLDGATTPSAAVPGPVPNYYPWMFHALVAFFAAFAPGGRPFNALGSLQVSQVGGVILALFALGRAVGRSPVAGAAAALFGALASGTVFAFVRSIDRLAPTPRTGARETFTAAFNNLAPPLPRDVGCSLLVAVLLLLLLGLTRNDRWLLGAAGVVLGATGLTTAEYFFAGLVIAVVSVPLLARHDRVAAWGLLLGPGLALYAIWLIPLAASYLRLGGFVNTTAIEAVVLAPGSILMSWGLATPLAAYGAFRSLPAARREAGDRLLAITFLSVGALILASSAAARVLGPGFTVLGRASRYWPVLHLAVALYAGMGAAHLIERSARASRALAAGLAAAMLAVALPVPARASWDYPSTVPRTRGLAAAVAGDGPTLYSALLRGGHATCVVAAPTNLSFEIFSYTGYRLVAFASSQTHRGNLPRIRWRDIYRLIASDEERARDLKVLEDPGADETTWRALVTRYGVNLLVVPRAETRDGFHGLPRIEPAGARLTVFLASACSS